MHLEGWIFFLLHVGMEFQFFTSFSPLFIDIFYFITDKERKKEKTSATLNLSNALFLFPMKIKNEIKHVGSQLKKKK